MPQITPDLCFLLVKKIQWEDSNTVEHFKESDGEWHLKMIKFELFSYMML